MSTPVVVCEDLTKDYGDTVGLSGLDLTVEAGEILGFLGPNGAGKTTAIRLLLDLIRPTRGRSRLFGRPAADPEVRARVGYLPGDLHLDRRLTGTQMLELLDALRPRGSRPADRARRAELCERLALTDKDLARVIRDDSTGTKQKLGLVAAFQHDPDLLVLDEPTSALDPLVREAVFELMHEAGAAGRTVFHSSHVLSEVEHTCTRVGVLRAGELVALESVDGLHRALNRRVVVTFAEAAPLAELAAVPGVTIEERKVREEHDGRRVELMLEGGFDPLLAVLARHPVEDVAMPGPDLVEVFRALYAGAAGNGPGDGGGGTGGAGSRGAGSRAGAPGGGEHDGGAPGPDSPGRGSGT